MQELTTYTRIDTVDGKVVKSWCYAVRGDAKEKERDTLVNRFADSLQTTINDSAVTYSLEVYKESEITNDTYLKSARKEIDRYSREHDFIWFFSFSRQQMFARTKYKNGQQVWPEPSKSEIIISPIPQ